MKAVPDNPPPERSKIQQIRSDTRRYISDTATGASRAIQRRAAVIRTATALGLLGGAIALNWWAAERSHKKHPVRPRIVVAAVVPIPAGRRIDQTEVTTRVRFVGPTEDVVTMPAIAVGQTAARDVAAGVTIPYSALDPRVMTPSPNGELIPIRVPRAAADYVTSSSHVAYVDAAGTVEPPAGSLRVASVISPVADPTHSWIVTEVRDTTARGRLATGDWTPILLGPTVAFAPPVPAPPPPVLKVAVQVPRSAFEFVQKGAHVSFRKSGSSRTMIPAAGSAFLLAIDVLKVDVDVMHSWIIVAPPSFDDAGALTEGDWMPIVHAP